MPFLFHAEKKSIFEQPPTRTQSPNTIRRIQHILEKESRSAAHFKVNVTINKSHPFRTINPIQQNNSFQDDKSNGRTRQDRQQALKKYYEMKWIRDGRRMQKRKAKQDQNKSAEDQTTGIEDSSQNLIFKILNLNSDHSTGEASPIHLGLNKISSKKYIKRTFPKNAIQKQNKENQCVPGPGSYNLKSSPSAKNSLFYRKSEQKSILSSSDLYSSSSQYSFSVQNENNQKNTANYFPFNYKAQLSANFKTPVSISRNSSLKSILFKSKVTTHTECTNQSQLEEEVPLTQTYPGPGQYSLAQDIVQKQRPHGKQIFISGVQKLCPLRKTDQPGPGSYCFKKEEKKLMGQAPFNSLLPRQLHFDTENLCQQQFLYSPKTSLIDNLPRIPRYPLNFGSPIQRFPQKEMQTLDPHRYASLEWLHPKNNPGVSMRFGSKRQLWNSGDCPIGPGQYSHQIMTIEKEQQKIVQKIAKQEHFIENRSKHELPQHFHEIVSASQTPQFALFSQQKIIPLKISPSQKLLFPIIHEQKQDKAQVNPPQIAFGQLPTAQNDRGIPKQQQFDGFYNVNPNWQQNSFNIHYRA